jgi:hypothetical protein
VKNRKEFLAQILGEFPSRDPLFEMCTRAWIAYYQTAHAIDGHIKRPGTPEEYELCKRAEREGQFAINWFFHMHGMNRDLIPNTTWKDARREAQNRLNAR